MQDLADIRADLAFTCAREADAIPAREPRADQLYRHARWLRRENLRLDNPAHYPPIERLLRIAAAWDHDLANLELRRMIERGQARSANPLGERLALTEALIARGIPGGYYDMARMLETGSAVARNPVLAMRYYRKAADLGSPEAQYVVGNLLDHIDRAPDIAEQMLACAAQQGHGKAAVSLGIGYKTIKKEYAQALIAFQWGVKGGNSSAASFLSNGFNDPASDDELYYLGQQADPERVRRYGLIQRFLSDYSYLDPKVPDVDDIVPLPPAPLPPWDGTLRWKVEFDANIPPPLPEAAVIDDMARTKGLDPHTGRPAGQPD